MGGVHIDDGAIVRAGSVVTKNIPEESIAAGDPAYVIKTRSELLKKILEHHYLLKTNCGV